MTLLLFTAGAVKYLDIDTVQPVAYSAYSASSQSSAATSSYSIISSQICNTYQKALGSLHI